MMPTNGIGDNRVSVLCFPLTWIASFFWYATIARQQFLARSLN